MKRLLIGLLLLVGLFVEGNVFAETPSATFTVNSQGDSADADINGVCATSGGVCTLRAAIQEANATAAHDTIVFSFTNPSISITSALPNITRPVTITGADCPTDLKDITSGSAPIRFTGAATGVDGLVLAAGSSGSTISGLGIDNFTGDGMQIESDDNTIECSHIGVWRTGAVSSGGNDLMGIRVLGDDNLIGGLLETQRNLIDSNAFAGIGVFNATGNQIYGNFIGVGRFLGDETTTSTGNGGNGVYIEGGSGNLVGNGTFARRNIIANNGASNNGNGVRINGGSAHAINYNHIGMDIAGTAALGNSSGGIEIDDGSSITIRNNVISGNNQDGIFLRQTTTNAFIENNTIGLDVNGNALGNQDNGLIISGGGVQGTDVNSNIIAHNGADGISIIDESVENALTKNSIYNNTGRGIELNKDGTDKNDKGDSDDGSNSTHNYPILTKAINIGHIEGMLDSTPGTHRVEFFQNDSCDNASNHGEGQRYLGFVNVTTAGDGTLVPFSVDLVPFAAGFVTATAADSDGNTSEFSECLPIDLEPIPLVVNSAGDLGDGNLSDGVCSTAARADECTLRAALEQANAFPTGAHITFANNYTIVPNSPLPSITTPVELDGLSQGVCSADPTTPHNLTIILDGANAGTADGLHFDTGSEGSEVHGLEIGRFSQHGIHSESNGNTFTCNHIGISTAITRFGNLQDGIHVTGSNNTIGGSSISQRNVISGNTDEGVEINSSVNTNVRGNYIGTSLDGRGVESNTGNGILNSSAPTTVIGGVGTNDGNVIGGNDIGVHVAFGSDATNRAQVIGNWIGIGKQGDAIGNTQYGVYLSNSAEFRIQDNMIHNNGNYGVFVDDYLADIQTTQNGIEDNEILFNNGGVYVGALTAVTVSGNEIGRSGSTPNIMIACDAAVANECEDSAADGNSGVIVEDNFIGVASNGTTVYVGSGIGVHLHGAEDVIVRRNTIATSSGSADMHVESNGSSNPAIQITVSENEIGISADGNTDLNAATNGIIVGTGVVSMTINDNQIGADGGAVLTLLSDSITVHGNSLGTNAAATLNAGGTTGLHADGSNSHLIYDNQIGFNSVGILLDDSDDNIVYGNGVGTNLAGTANIGNTSFGIQITNDSDRNHIGDANATYNVIRNNGGDGIAIFDTTGGPSRQNRLFASTFGNNGGIPIDLGPSGITANDSCDIDAGQNDLQNFPVLTAVTNEGNVEGTLDTSPSRNELRVDVFTSASCDGTTGEAEGERWYGSEVVSTGQSGLTNISVPKLSPDAALPYFVAIVTDLGTGNTSEFSSCYEASTPTAIALTLTEVQSADHNTLLIVATIALALIAIWAWRRQRRLFVLLAVVLLIVGELSSAENGSIALIPVVEAVPDSCIQFNQSLENGSSIEGAGGVVLGALPNTLDEDLEVNLISIPLPEVGYTGPGNRVTTYYRITPEIDVEADDGAGFLVGIPVPNGINGNDVAAAIWTPENVMEDEVAGGTWLTSPVSYDATSNLATFHLTKLVNTGAEVTLITYPQFDPIPEPSSRSVQAAGSTPNFVITCSTQTAVCDQQVKNEVEAVFKLAYDEIVNTMGFREPALAHTYFSFATMNTPLGIPIPTSTPYVGSTYWGITVYDKSADECEGVQGSYGPLTRTIVICLEPSGIDSDTHETIVHEFFHAIQHAYPNTPKATPKENKWVIEGTATAIQFLPLYNVRTNTREWARTDRRLTEYNKSTLYHYRAQDFWIFSAFNLPPDLRYLHDMFENYGTSIYRVASYFDNVSPFGSFGEHYWGYARNHAYEHVFDFNTGFPSECYLATSVPYNITSIYNTITHNHLVRRLEIELNHDADPLRTRVWEVNVEQGVPRLEIEVIAHAGVGGAQVHSKIYEVGDNGCAASHLPGTRQFNNVASNTKFYILVANTHYNVNNLTYDVRVESFADE